MISEHHREAACLYAIGALPEDEQQAFEVELRADLELRELAALLQHAASALAITTPAAAIPAGLKSKVMERIAEAESATSGTDHVTRTPVPIRAEPRLEFRMSDEAGGWKELPVRGAWIKLLSIQRDRGYAVLMGKLDAGVRYPAHVNTGPEDFCIVSGDLHVGARRLGPGDFHHADAGSYHEVNYSVEGCTLVAVLEVDHPLVALAMS